MSAMVDLGAVYFCQLRVLSTLLKTTRKGLLLAAGRCLSAASESALGRDGGGWKKRENESDCGF